VFKGHVLTLDVRLPPCIVLPSLDDIEIVLREDDKIFRVDVTVRPFFGTPTCLVELWLEECPGIVCSVILWIRNISPA
jgi:hypothetical protein